MQNQQNSEAVLDRAATRVALLGAARIVAARDGIEAVTLAKVGSEAGLSRAAVYSQFARKEDILMSIVSDDLAALARGMDGIDWPQGGDTPETAVILSLPRPAEPPAPDPSVPAPSEMIDVAKDVSAALASAPLQAEPAAPRQRLARRGELAQVLDAKPIAEAKPGAEEPDAKPAEAPRTPDAWLERRLRTFERSVSGLEARQDQVEKSARASAAAAEDGVKALQAAVEELKARADAADARHKAAASETRVALNETALRIQTVEGVARAALAENTPAEAPAATPAPQPVAIAPAPEPVPAPVTGEAVSSDDAPKSFIAGVRKSVVAATAAAAVQAQPGAGAEKQTERRGLTRYLIGGLIVLTLFIAGAGIAFSKGVSDGRHDAMLHVAYAAPRAPSLHRTSLDQLSARAEAGDPAAELQIGLRYRDGAAKDPVAALHWLTLSAIHGQPVAQYLLGTLYAQSDAAKALQWYEAAALQGNRKAMHALAIAYAEGQGAAKSPSEAVRWFSRAAGFGYVDSQFNLAVLYEQGAGVPQSLLDAYKWYTVASRAGDAEAKARVEALRTQLTGDDLAAAQNAANAFHALPMDMAANAAP